MEWLCRLGLEKIGVFTRLLSAIKMEQIAEPYIRRRAIRHLEKGRVVIFGAGTGNPYFTTDTAGSLRAIEINASVILKGTRVDGIYTADPEKDSTAKKFDKITFAECISKNLRVMDMTAFTLCMENNLPIVVFDMNRPGNLRRVVTGEKVGTLVTRLTLQFVLILSLFNVVKNFPGQNCGIFISFHCDFIYVKH